MASAQTEKKNTSKPAQAAPTPAAASAMEPPEGFERIGLPSIDGWYEPAGGKPVYGKLLGEFKITQFRKQRGSEEPKKEERWVAVVGLGAETSAKMNQAEITLAKGQVCGVGIRAKLADLLKYAPGTVVWLKPTTKKDIGNGQTMWEFDLRIDPRTAKKKTADELASMNAQSSSLPVDPATDSGGAGFDDDDIPF